MNSIWEPWNIEVTNERTTEDVAKQLYEEHFCIATILEAFIVSKEVEFKNLNRYVFSVVPAHIFNDMSVARFNLVLAKMVRLGYLETNHTSDKQVFIITDLGIDMWQQQTFQTMAASSFFNYQSQLLNTESHKLNKTSVTLNKSVLMFTAISVVIAIVSVIIAVIALLKT
jgi:hypothetical protein